jgi:hypothetical protein
MSIQTLIARIINAIPGLSSNLQKLSRLKAAAEKDYNVIVSDAEQALVKATKEVEAMASNELSALKTTIASVEARAAVLVKTAVLDADKALHAGVLGKITTFVQTEIAAAETGAKKVVTEVETIGAEVIADVEGKNP